MEKILGTILSLFLSLNLLSIKDISAEEVNSLAADENKESNKIVIDYINQSTKIDDPFKLRDPFREPLPSGEMSLQDTNKNTIFQDDTNLVDVPSLDTLSLNELRVTGILIGKDRRALAQGSDDKILILKEGMKVGENKAEIKAILPGGIVLVEKMTNIYGQDEYLETVIPITDARSLKKAKK